MATENVKVLTLDTQPAQVSVKDLRNELKELRSTLLSTEKGTEEYNDALKKSAEITHTLKEQTEEINATAMDFGQIASNVSKSVGGMVAGFQAAKATLSLFGVENEEVLQSLKKMQDLMAITQALPAIDNGIKAFKRLGIVIKSATAGLNGMKAALVSTGIGAIAVAVGLLAANWDKVTDAMKRWGVINEDTQKKIDEQKKKVEDLQTELKKLEGSYGEWQTQQKYNKLNKESKKAYDDLADSLKDYQYQLDIISNKMQQTDDKTLYNQLRNEGVEIKNNIASLQAQQQAILANADSYKEVEKSTNSAKSAAEAEVNALVDIQKKYALLSEEISLYNKTDDEKNLIALEKEESEKLSILKASLEKQLITDEEYESQIAIIHQHYEEEKTKVTNREEEERRKKAEEEAQKRVEILQKWVEDTKFDYSSDLEQIQAREDAELAILNESYNNSLLNEEEYQKLLTDIKAKYTNERTEIARREAEDEKQIQAMKMDAYFQIANNVSDILTSIADSMDENNKEQFEAAKAFNISAAVINTLTGAIQAYTGAAGNAGINAIPVVGPALAQALGISSAAAVAAAGAAQIAKISKTKFGDKGTGNAKISSTPSTSAVQSLTAPVYTQDVQGASIEGAIKEQKVWVSETDISNTQNRVKVSETEATF